ncbi:Nin-like protein [Aminobacter aganoensis]|uniref:3'-phosphoadenosine 5'-phosphosulfate sulfotransferase (PAPS reductase)/FAD synthetase n=1 Tax=Aminobacter aganoensis TaxID=83264 RepID=A0A7X0F5P8_9HYPH|nr:hypothetical protein [Aminobacter aganoensis]MBB6353539.1 3'-phosphoadenosine 5'-phosphosulfate sulfotransferase (PAPS reductase)/FAD synthetase [Aminobacter aganoensis]
MASPFLLPDGNVQIAFSGGRTSGRMLHDIILANQPWPADRVKVIFTNTGKEREETLEFVRDCSVHWDVDIIWLEYRLRWTGGPHDPKNKVFDTKAHSFDVVTFETASRNGEPFEQLVQYFGFLPNRVADFCSHNLKSRTARRYCVVEGWEHWTTAIGMRSDEPQRILKKQPKERYRVWYPLNGAGITKPDVSLFWLLQPFDLALLDVDGVTPSGNCDGCFKKSERKRAELARSEWHRAEWWAALERQYGGTFDKTTSWDELRGYINRQGDWLFQDNDALCQRDQGECSPW